MKEFINSIPNRLLYEEEVFDLENGSQVINAIPLGGFAQYQAVTHFLLQTESRCYGLGFDAHQDCWVVIEKSDAEDVADVCESVEEWVNETYPDIERAELGPDQ